MTNFEQDWLEDLFKDLLEGKRPYEYARVQDWRVYHECLREDKEQDYYSYRVSLELLRQNPARVYYLTISLDSYTLEVSMRKEYNLTGDGISSSTNTHKRYLVTEEGVLFNFFDIHERLQKALNFLTANKE